jgi:uncharacterized damage-inducible protein DinB
MINRLDHYRNRFAYEDWANRLALESLQSADPPSDRGRKLLAHIIGAQDVWLSRLEPGEPNTNGWPDLSTAEIEARVEGLRGIWEMKFDQLTETSLDELVSYRNLAGDPFTTPLWQILEHLLFHGAYHRGQIAAQVRAEGGAPILTDYIQYTRCG